MTETEEMTPRQICERRIEKLESIAWDIERGLERLNGEIEQLRAQYPPLCGVWEVQVGARAWYTDGHRAIRDAWPGDYDTRENPPDLTKLLMQWEHVTTPVSMVGMKTHPERDPLAELSDGTYIRAAWMRELLHGRGYTMHHEAGGGAVVFRDQAGDLAAAVMPVTVSQA